MSWNEVYPLGHRINYYHYYIKPYRLWKFHNKVYTNVRVVNIKLDFILNLDKGV